MNRNTTEPAADAAPTFNFALGLMAGACIGAGLVLWLSPQARAEARRTLSDSAQGWRDRAAEQYGEASRRVVVAVDDLAAKSAGLRDAAADAVARGAHEVERVAVAVKASPASRSL